MVDRPDEQHDNPETGAITGGVPAAAEPSPQIRGREASARSSVYVFVVLGVFLLVVAAFADQDGSGRIGTIAAAVALLAIAAMRVSGLAGPALTAALGFIGGVLLTITAFAADGFGGVELALLIVGAATFIVSFASLAASERPVDGDEEPTAGVENV